MAEDRNACFNIKTALNSILNVSSGNRIAFGIFCAFGNDNNIVTASGVAACIKQGAEIFTPLFACRRFGNKHHRGSGSDGAHKCKISAIASHYFHNKCALMAVCSTAEVVD